MKPLLPDELPLLARASRWLLAAGLLGGAALAAAGLLVRTDAGLPPQAVARVNDQLILRDAWLRAVAAVASERRTPLSDADQRHILDRLVDEELLVQRGLALGLPEQDARLRSTLVSEVMLAATQSVPGLDDAALKRFYEENRDFFAPAGRLRVQAWRLDARGQLTEFQPAVPDTLLPLAKLQAYLGPALTAKAVALEAGDTIEADGLRLKVLEKQPGVAPAFEQVRDEVRAEAKRRADESSVRALLAELRRAGRVVVDPTLQ